MEAHSDSEGVKKDFVAKFPRGAADLAYEIWRALVQVHWEWKTYRALYATSPEHIEILNSAAPAFFGHLDSILFYNIVLAIARLQDPPTTGGTHDNASLARLVETLAHENVAPSQVRKWSLQLENLQAYCKPLRHIRNHILAHADLETTLHYHEDPKGLSREYVDGALKLLRELLNAIEQHFQRGRTSFEWVVPPEGDAEALIHALKSAREHEKCRGRDFQERYGFSPRP